MFEGNALGWMAGTWIWMPGAPRARRLPVATPPASSTPSAPPGPPSRPAPTRIRSRAQGSVQLSKDMGSDSQEPLADLFAGLPDPNAAASRAQLRNQRRSLREQQLRKRAAEPAATAAKRLK